ncbi:MAG: hypothetical protein JWN65_1854 [Solirubrobacterales bacterium]|jgi:biotin operon repressor|nr:hypothetical protein [Solirubrobacterales bacterium]
MQQVIKALEAERAEVQERLAWLDQTIEEFRKREEGPPPTVVTPAPAPKRSARRGTAVRASNRRHAARDLKPDPAERIITFLTEHPQSTSGAVAKGLNVNRSTVAAQMAKLEKTGELVKGAKGYSLPAAEGA